MKSLPDNELIRRIQHSDDSSEIRLLEEEIYNRYVKEVYAKCLNIVRKKNIAQDLTHDIFIKIFLNVSSYKGMAPFSSWVNSIVYNTSINYLKKEKKLKSHLDQVVQPEATTLEEQETMFEEEINLKLLEKGLLSLKASHRLVLMMKYVDNLSIQEISKKLNIKESATKMRLKRSRAQLYTIIQKLKEK